MENQTDVVVVGAGPAGLSAAWQLTGLGLRVAVVERGGQQAYRLPETVIVHAGLPDADENGLFRAFKDMAEPVADIAFVSPLGDQRMRLQYGAGKNRLPRLASLDRSRYDSAMRLAYETAGNAIAYSTTVTHIAFNDGGVEVSCKHQEGERTLGAKLVIDASGKSYLLKNLLGLQADAKILDRRSSFFAHFELDAAGNELLESRITLLPMAEGFIYAIWMGGNRISIGVTLFKEIADELLTESFWAAISSVPWLHAVLSASAKQVLPILKVQNSAFAINELAGDRHVIVGDAGGFHDPFLFCGTEFALRAGQLAAHCAIKLLITRDKQGIGDAKNTYIREVSDLRIRNYALLQDALTESSWPLIPMHLTDPHIPYSVLSFLLGFTGRTGNVEDKLQAIRAELWRGGG